jgi:hypothetical protein
MGLDWSAVDDVVQTVSLVMWRKRDQFDPDTAWGQKTQPTGKHRAAADLKTRSGLYVDRRLWPASHAQPAQLVRNGCGGIKAVNEVVESGILTRVLAQTDIDFSKSMIESFWRILKHQWLFLNTLDTVATVEKLVTFYVEQHNTHMPHSAFQGQTPDEMYFGTEDDIPKQLQESRIAARESRMKMNRAQTCQACEELVAISC